MYAPTHTHVRALTHRNTVKIDEEYKLESVGGQGSAA